MCSIHIPAPNAKMKWRGCKVLWVVDPGLITSILSRHLATVCIAGHTDLPPIYTPPPPHRQFISKQAKQEAILSLISLCFLAWPSEEEEEGRCLAAAATAGAAAAASAATAAADARCSLMWRPQPPPRPSSSLLHPTRRALEEWRWRWRAARTAAAAATPASVAPPAAAAPAAPATESIVVALLHEDLSYGCCYCRSELDQGLNLLALIPIYMQAGLACSDA